MDKALLSFAQENGLKPDEATGVLFGYAGGYHVCLVPGQNNVFTLLFSVRRAGALPPQEELTALAKSSKQISACKLQKDAVTVTVKPNGWSRAKSLANAKAALSEAVDTLRHLGYVDACQACGQEGATDSYLINGSYMHLCPSCFGGLSAQSGQRQYVEKRKPENLLGGLVGALLGSLLGVLVMVLLDQLGYVAALSGIVMAICALKGYELLGGKLSGKGIAVSTVIMVLMVYLGNRLTWSIAAYQELGDYLGVGFFAIFRALSEILELAGAEAQDSYIRSLVLQYFFVALGAVPTVISARRNKTFKGAIHQLGRSE